MAERQRREKVQHENEDAELERMIASMPVLFRERVRKQVMVNRRQAARVANAIGGTNGARLMKGVSSLHEDKKEESKKASSQMSLPVPVLTEVYHQGGFDKHIERQKEVRRRKAQLERKFRKFKWAPGHTITKPFSFESRQKKSRSAAEKSIRKRRPDQPKSRISGYFGSLDLESARGMSSPGRKSEEKKKKVLRKKKKTKKTVSVAASAVAVEKGADTDSKREESKEGKTVEKKTIKKKKKKKKAVGGVKSRVDSFQSKKLMRLTQAKRRDYVRSRGTIGATLDNREHTAGSIASLGNTKARATVVFR